ncbi:putative E3 ubiquitin-protein ligase hel2 [Blattamonas nauphoetae]|uniref:E3 ubiquitin-protein ligase hel2 n=1 Tax=Blattamonas nauphoetae TaxID=2049346 RepID=A0ABQ9XL84_9EUKA|nr:putative E3 ubiquitin-protein ligase hel2 [Blattamonas nauphoetae]
MSTPKKTFQKQYTPGAVHNQQSTEPEPDIQSLQAPIDDDAPICILCATPIVSFAIGKCNHNDVCSLCVYRLRRFMKSKSCPTCRCEQEAVVFSPNDEHSFQDYRASDFNTEQIDRTLGIFYADTDIQQKIANMNTPRCSLCKEQFPTIQLLQNHLNDVHHKEYCLLCVEKRPLFLSEQSLFTSKTIILHRQGKLQDDISGGHPYCNFCKSYHFDTESFRKHMNTAHEKCFICENAGKTDEYYPNYQTLQNHFRKMHFFCENENCVQNRYVVFASDLELLQHQAAVHGNVTPSNLVNSKDVRINHNAIHINLSLLQMNQPRGHRGRRREEEEPVTPQSFHNMFVDPSQLDPRSFPSLSDQAQSEFANNYHSVWKAGKINEELFPSLPGGTPVRSNPMSMRVKREVRRPRAPPQQPSGPVFPSLDDDDRTFSVPPAGRRVNQNTSLINSIPSSDPQPIFQPSDYRLPRKGNQLNNQFPELPGAKKSTENEIGIKKTTKKSKSTDPNSSFPSLSSSQPQSRQLPPQSNKSPPPKADPKPKPGPAFPTLPDTQPVEIKPKSKIIQPKPKVNEVFAHDMNWNTSFDNWVPIESQKGKDSEMMTKQERKKAKSKQNVITDDDWSSIPGHTEPRPKPKIESIDLSFPTLDEAKPVNLQPRAPQPSKKKNKENKKEEGMFPSLDTVQSTPPDPSPSQPPKSEKKKNKNKDKNKQPSQPSFLSQPSSHSPPPGVLAESDTEDSAIPPPAGLTEYLEEGELNDGGLLAALSSPTGESVEDRNNRVVRTLRGVISEGLDGDMVETVMSSFLSTCDEYRRHNMNASRFFSTFYGLFGEVGVESCFDDLVSLLPSPVLRTELQLAREEWEAERRETAVGRKEKRRQRQEDRDSWQIDFRTVGNQSQELFAPNHSQFAAQPKQKTQPAPNLANSTKKEFPGLPAKESLSDIMKKEEERKRADERRRKEQRQVPTLGTQAQFDSLDEVFSSSHAKPVPQTKPQPKQQTVLLSDVHSFPEIEKRTDKKNKKKKSGNGGEDEFPSLG